MAKISMFPEATSLGDDDLLLITTAGTTYKITAKEARKYYQFGYSSPRRFQSGRWFDQAGANNWTSANTTNFSAAATRLYLQRFTPEWDVTIDRIGVNVMVTGTSAFHKILIYDSNASGYPNNLIFVSTPISMSAGTGLSFQDLSSTTITFSHDQMYWMGVVTSDNGGQISSVKKVPGAYGWGASNDTGTDQMNVILRVGIANTYNNPPNPFALQSTDLTYASSYSPSIRMRAV